MSHQIKLTGGLLFILLNFDSAFSQCTTSTDGQNIIVNGDFETGASGFTSGYIQHCLCPAPGCSGRDVESTGFSNAGEYCVGNDVHQDFHCCLPGDRPFNVIPTNFTDRTPGAGNYALLVDGACTAGIPVWSQTLTVQASTNYYFTAWVTSLFTSGNYADLRFMINGVQQGTSITGPANSSTWVSYTQLWSSGATSGVITVSIVNNNTNCGAGNDFAIDDIAFTAGCAFGSAGPVPLINAGAPSTTLCGGGGLLNSGVSGGTLEFIWKKDGSIIGGATSATYTASATGVYEVCVRETVPPSCYRSDQITVTNTYSVNLGSDLTLCTPPSVTLDAVHQGGGVTYVWRKNGTVIPGATFRTYLVSSAGTYRVDVTDPGCGVQFDEIIISSNLTVTPNDVFFCSPPDQNVNLSVTGAGVYNWYSASTGGAILAGGTNTTTYTTPPINSNTTYYVEDATLNTYTVGPDRGDIGGGIGGNEDRRDNNYGGGGTGDFFMEFQTFKPNVRINSVIVYAYCNAFPNCSGNVVMSIYNTSNTLVYQSAPYAFTNITQNAYTQLTVPINITIAAAGIYRAAINGSTTGTVLYLLKTNMAPVACNYNAFNVPGTFQFNVVRPSWMTCPFGYFFKWNISAPGDCGRIPVQAIMNCALPVDLINFKGLAKNSTVLLSWSTLSEKNNSYFNIERSVDGVNFEIIGKVNGYGNSSIQNQYTFTDPNPLEIASYRLRQVDFDGNFSYSDIIVVDRKSNVYYMNVYPVPVKNKDILNVELFVSDNYAVEMSVIDLLGKEFYSLHYPCTSGNNHFEIDTKEFLPGLYFLKVSSEEGNIITKKIIIE